MFNYRFTVGAITILAGVLAALCLVVGVLAVEYDFSAFSHPIAALQYAKHYKLAYWFMILDLFGYYLLLLPVIFYLHQQYKYRSPWTLLFTFSGLAYVFTGAIGAAILAVLWPEQMQQYLLSPQNRETITAIFSSTTVMVTKGLWNILEVLFAAVWWIGSGKLLYKENKGLGVITILAGISTLLDGAGNIFGLDSLAETGLSIYLLMGIAWPLIIGGHLVRKSIFNQHKSSGKKSRSSLEFEMEEIG